MATKIESFEITGYKLLQPRGIDDDDDIVVLMALPGIPDPINNSYHAIWYSKKKDEVTELPFLRESDPVRLTNVNKTGKIACGYDKLTGDVLTWQPGLGLNTYTYIGDYKYARPTAINTSKTFVGFCEGPIKNGIPKRVGMFKSGNGENDIDIFIHPSAIQSTEFTSIDDSGIAIGITDHGDNFYYNTNTGEWGGDSTRKIVM